MFDLFSGFNGSKLKAQLKMAMSRFQITSNKKSAIVKQQMREVAMLLNENPPKEEKARIKAEALIREDNMIEAYDILSLECELLSERIKLIEFSKQCPPDLVTCVSTIIYAAPRLDIPELQQIRKQFKAKYGKKFEEAALNNTGGVINERVATKLSVQPPAAFLVQTYLERICEQEEVNWKPTVRLTAAQMAEPMAAPSGFSVPVGQGTGLGPVSTGLDNGSTATGSVSVTPEVTATPVFPTAPSAGGHTASTSGDFDEPDIFIPAAPGQSHTNASATVQPMQPPGKEDDKSNGDNDSNNNGSNRPPPSAPAAGGDGGMNSSYADLAARFDNLKNL